MTAQVTGVTEVHISADEADVFDYNLEFGRDPALFPTDVDTNVADGGYRASDHDPVIVGLDPGPGSRSLGCTKLPTRSSSRSPTLCRS